MQLDTRLESHDMLLRIFLYGDIKTKKTWWAGKAAEAGYNVLLLDGDDGWHILNNIAPAARKRIQVVNMTDNRGHPIFAAALSRLLKDGKMVWDEKAKKSAKLSPNGDCMAVNLDLLDANCVLIVDSWTAICRSLMLQYARENMIETPWARLEKDSPRTSWPSTMPSHPWQRP